MQEILMIMNELQNTSSRNEKEDLLDIYKGNELFKTILQFVYNPFIVTGLSDKKMKKKTTNKVSLEFDYDLDSIEEVMKYLQQHNTGRDMDIANIQDFILRQPENQRELIMQIVTKSLKLGITSNTMNKIYGKDFIPSFNVMLAEKYFDNVSYVEGKEFILTLKLDGNRILAIKEGETVSMFTRQGQTYEGLLDIEEELLTLSDGVYDGELIAENPNGLNSADLYRVTTSIVRKDGIKKGVVFHIFDSMPVKDFKSGKCTISCLERKEFIHDMFGYYPERFKWLKEVPILYQGKDLNVIPKLLDGVIANGGEGLMLNILEAGYLTKRTKNILKIKKMQTCDCMVTGFEEGQGRNLGTLGAIVIDYKGNGVKVGGGYSDSDRSYIWRNREELLGRVIEVQYFEESKNKDNDSLSLRFPVYKCTREVGKEVSYF